MSGKKNIKLGSDSEAVVIGIASDEHIWRICWSINQSFNLSLEAEKSFSIGSPIRNLYFDTTSDEEVEYYLFAQDYPARKLTALSRKFPFWMVVRPMEKADRNSIIHDLKKLAQVAFAVDLTEEKNIQKLIP